jgi:hypothetical protein
VIHTKKHKKQKLNVEKIVPWTLSKKVQDIVDSCLKCIVVPVGNTQNFEVRNLFQQTGMLKGHAKIQTISVVMPMIMTFAKFIDGMAEEYLSFI